MLSKRIIVLGWIGVLILLLSGCTAKDSQPKISLEKFDQQARMMTEICQKLVGESNVERMHKAAWSIEKARVVSCRSVGDECKAYGVCLSKAIKFTEDKRLSASEAKELKSALAQLKASLAESRKKFK